MMACMSSMVFCMIRGIGVALRMERDEWRESMEAEV